MTSEVAVQVIEAVARVKRIPAQNVQIESRLEELGMDSLDGLNLFFELEETFDLTIPDEQARSLRSVRQIVETICRLLEQREISGDEHLQT